MTEPIRRAGVQDADEVARLLRAFNLEYEDPAPPQELMAERIRVLLDHGDTIILVAGEPPCALSVTRFRPGLWSPKLESYLAELYVVPVTPAAPRALKNLAMMGPSSGPPLTPPLSWTTMAKAMSPS